MTLQEIVKEYQSATRCIDESAINEAFAHLTRLITESSRGDMSDELERLRMSYTFMLRYLEQGVLDPQRDEILYGIRQSLYTLCDRCIISLMEPTSPEVFFARRRELAGTTLIEIIENYRDALKQLSLVQTTTGEKTDNHVILSRLREAETLEIKLFNRVWSSFPLSPDDAESIRLCISGDILPIHTRCLLVAALMLGLMRYYD